ncbi:hypothetical protein [Flavobacterium sp. UMI-01]|uniref:hypothetical protein n=1 Tax=Flavobacterium sp. UMI-01 TaxID=1441053 RepID=UPI001C7CE7B3|nr:hypothetical protein [Flavobacterium sp. UMI-01]GIZ10083.1 hypothetical protein FUMI01_28090 [Flavobacterium sp. UMI-01]
MKKIILSLSLALALVSCSTDALDNNSEMATNGNLSAKGATTKSVITTVIPSSQFNLVPYDSQENNCIATESEIYYEKTAQTTISWGGPNNDMNSKTVYIKYFNTATHFVVQVLSTNGFSDVIKNNVSTGLQAAANTWGTHTYPLQANWKAGDVETLYLQVAGNGPQAIFNINYSLIGLCPEATCENAFTGTAVSCGTSREANYTFTSKEDLTNLKIQGGLTNFTGSDAVVTITGGNLIASQKTPGGSSNRVITIEGSVAACETITVNIKWNSFNSGGLITGDWSASGTNVNVNSILPLSCN